MWFTTYIYTQLLLSDPYNHCNSAQIMQISWARVRRTVVSVCQRDRDSVDCYDSGDNYMVRFTFIVYNLLLTTDNDTSTQIHYCNDSINVQNICTPCGTFTLLYIDLWKNHRHQFTGSDNDMNFPINSYTDTKMITNKVTALLYTPVK